MSAYRWSSVLAFLLGTTAMFCAALPAHARAKSVQIDLGWLESQYTPLAYPFEVMKDPFTLNVTAGPGGESDLLSPPNTDVLNWCDAGGIGGCDDFGDDFGNPVLAQLYVNPPEQSGNITLNVFFDCSDSFTFSVNGSSETPTCSKGASEFDGTYIYSSNGSLLQLTSVPEPGTGALFVAALGLLWAGRRLYVRGAPRKR